jgi:hypothetical protein
MQEENSKKKLNDFDNEIDLLEFFHALWDGKWIIVSLTTFASIAGVIYSLSLPNIYESRAMLVPANSSSGISGALRGFGGLAGLAGISLPSSGDQGNSAVAIKKISTLSFYENNILTNIYLPDLMAFKSWNSEKNTVSYDKNLYDNKSKTWIVNDSDSMQKIPSIQKSFKAFKSKLSLVEDDRTGFVTISIKHQSPYLAKQWVELVVDEVNSFYRQKDKSESEKAARYLNQQISMTSLSEIKEVLAQLLQEEIKKLTLIEANKFYVFDYIDPPAVMELKVEPSRALICIISAILGGILSLVLVLIKHFVFKEKVT